MKSSLPLLLATLPALAGLFFAEAQAATRPTATLSLRPSYGGAVLQGRIALPKADTLINVSSSLGQGRMLQCAPRCTVVKSIPVQTANVVGNETKYRIALGGQFKVGKKVNVTLRFKNQGVLTVQALVSR